MAGNGAVGNATLGIVALSRWRVTLLGICLVAVCACEGIGSGTTISPSTIALRPGDLPSVVKRCSGSGTIGHYLASVGTKSAAGTEIAASWRRLRSTGGREAAVVVYASEPSACVDRFGAGPGTTASSLVVRCDGPDAARAIYQQGLLGFVTPDDQEVLPGLVQGTATGLGHNSWLLQETTAGAPVSVALWQRGAYVALVVTVGLSPPVARVAILAVDRRMP